LFKEIEEVTLKKEQLFIDLKTLKPFKTWRL